MNDYLEQELVIGEGKGWKQQNMKKPVLFLAVLQISFNCQTAGTLTFTPVALLGGQTCLAWIQKWLRFFRTKYRYWGNAPMIIYMP